MYKIPRINCELQIVRQLRLGDGRKTLHAANAKVETWHIER